MSCNTKRRIWSLRYTSDSGDAEKAVEAIANSVGVSEITAKLIYNRGYRTVEAARSFLCPSSSLFHDPYLMRDMDRAVERLALALERHEHITIYGDYDVDGVTSVTLLYLYLKGLGAAVDYYIPLRAREGYGLSRSALDALKRNGTELIITVDTGITAVAETEYARELGMDTVVTDHHECHGDLPNACAVVNPHRPDCGYPFDELAGVGVVFKLVCAYEIMRRADISADECVNMICEQYIDLVAIGTVADVMPLVDENREIVKRGLVAIEKNARIGLSALIEAASSSNVAKSPVSDKYPTKKRRINSGFVSFSLAPRINAAGRISSASKAVELLLANDCERAEKMAQELCEINAQRQREENSIAEQAYKMIEESCDLSRDRVIVLENDRWQQGIIGIVASRITEKYGLPSILISFDGAMIGDEPHSQDVGKGSGRSVKGMNLVGALDHCGDLLVQFGGHELAAGLSIVRENIGAFRKKINEYAAEQAGDDIFSVGVEADCEIQPEYLTMSLAEEMSMLEPFGVANPTPTFVVKGVRLDKIISMGAGKHTKIIVSCGASSFSAVCFGVPTSTFDYHIGERIDLLFGLSINEFRGQRALQLTVQDIRLSPELENEYILSNERYEKIISGSDTDIDDGIIPSRADAASVYKFLKYENMCGRTVFTYRSLYSEIREQLGLNISMLKLRLIIRILSDIQVCRYEELGERSFSVEVLSDAPKTSIESSETYYLLSLGRRRSAN